MDLSTKMAEKEKTHWQRGCKGLDNLGLLSKFKSWLRPSLASSEEVAEKTVTAALGTSLPSTPSIDFERFKSSPLYLKSINLDAYKNIYVVDDDPTIAMAWGVKLGDSHTIHSICSKEEICGFYEVLKTEGLDVSENSIFLVDYNLNIEGLTGIQVAQLTKESVPTVIVSNSDEDVIRDIVGGGLDLEFMPKRYISE